IVLRILDIFLYLLKIWFFILQKVIIILRFVFIFWGFFVYFHAEKEQKQTKYPKDIFKYLKNKFQKN
ncbi:hypothetical protein C6B37_02710, partial [Candidatus Phytoplasma phoenicium]